MSYLKCKRCGVEWEKWVLRKWAPGQVEAFLKGEGCPECLGEEHWAAKAQTETDFDVFEALSALEGESSAAITAETKQISRVPHIWAFLGAVLVFIGVFLPWIQVGTLLINRGINNPDGALVLGFSLIAIIAAVYGFVYKRAWPGVVYVLCAAILFWVALVDLGEVQVRVQEARETILGEAAMVGAGLYMILVGAVITGASGVIALISGALMKPEMEETQESVERASTLQSDSTYMAKNTGKQEDLVSKLEKLAALKRSGMLTEEEYEQAKSKLLRGGNNQ